MSVLVMTAESMDALRALRALADAEPVGIDRCLEMVAGTAPPIGDDSRFVVFVPLGFRIVLSRECHLVSGVQTWYYHFSASVGKTGAVPAPAALMEIVKVLDLPARLPTACWMETISEHGSAVNLLFPVVANDAVWQHSPVFKQAVTDAAAAILEEEHGISHAAGAHPLCPKCRPLIA